jgi:hypothetical protein
MRRADQGRAGHAHVDVLDLVDGVRPPSSRSSARQDGVEENNVARGWWHSASSYTTERQRHKRPAAAQTAGTGVVVQAPST